MRLICDVIKCMDIYFLRVLFQKLSLIIFSKYDFYQKMYFLERIPVISTLKDSNVLHLEFPSIQIYTNCITFLTLKSFIIRNTSLNQLNVLITTDFPGQFSTMTSKEQHNQENSFLWKRKIRSFWPQRRNAIESLFIGNVFQVELQIFLQTI